MAMDYLLSDIVKETINKEMTFQRRIKDQQLAAKAAQQEALGIAATTIAAPAKRISCQINQLDQSFGMFQNPHAHDGRPRVNSDPQKILRYGTSTEGQGRSAYLRLEKQKGPHERFGRSITTAQEVGWTAAAATKTYTSSPFARRPLIKNQFYRPMGVSFSTGAL
eukprot:TRINITY_DN96544_c0_g1_i1.p1 TRINITY_DN96544_c0_g1~~TRINITY_DN96544_c0_g1_i1.p1  ORF type:complete len:165 (+),score=23.91 TRINITY_DN96544_c0_g1_i1:83-577(+)